VDRKADERSEPARFARPGEGRLRRVMIREVLKGCLPTHASYIDFVNDGGYKVWYPSGSIVVMKMTNGPAVGDAA
jgi:hypothetical protein